MARPSEAPSAERVLELAWSRPATLGDGRLVCIDGRAGSGKSTLARAVTALAGDDERVVHMDDLYEGWSGLPTIDAQLDGLLRPLAAGRPGGYRRYDWERGEYAETVSVSPGSLLVLEGVGSGSRGTVDLATVVVWIEAAYDVRMRRGIERDGEAFAPYWEQWAAAEAEHFARHRTRERADLVFGT
ncbi:4-amino-4-deoxy-L-arabinose transferase [Nocardioides sp. YIM 152315]|uniref:4-amino-4-deoxy-L-arabinose transferase n=1 Tax=Nocardioides sp. YIM 152315 TaxID=3031760 RepID=UPI0023DC4BC3|nr:4-amino-4-deoxy-L-arabinose transferase [Nocardioides sp. YIM 152315]MDF1603879.1 4-amino-4-deoxy-L-arabinose transferase [Nocardioides sp. YIM 152315]